MQTPLERELTEARRQTDELLQIVRPDSLYERPIPERHRIIFYLGHLEAFDWNLMARYALDLPEPPKFAPEPSPSRAYIGELGFSFTNSGRPQAD